MFQIKIRFTSGMPSTNCTKCAHGGRQIDDEQYLYDAMLVYMCEICATRRISRSLTF